MLERGSFARIGMCSTACALAVVLAPAACKSGSDAPERDVAAASAAPSTAAPVANATGPRLSVDGQPLVIRSALAYAAGPTSIDLLLTSNEIACSDARARSAVGDAIDSLRVRLAAGLDRDGKLDWRVTEAAFDGAVHSGNVAKAEVTRADDGNEVSARFSLKLRGAAPTGGPPKKLEFRGEVHATECGTVPTAGGAERPQPDLVFEVAGKRLGLRGASVVRTPTGIELRLTTVPHDCGTAVLEGDAVLKLEIEGSPPEVKSSFLGGELFESQLSGSAVSREQLTVAPFTLAPDQSEVRVTLKGTFDLVGYAVRLDGTATALVCK